MTSTPVPPLVAHQWSQSEPLIVYYNGWGDGRCGFEEAYPVHFTLLPTGDLYLTRWNDSLQASEITATRLSRQATCNLLNSVDQAGFFDYDPSTYVKDPKSWVRPIAGPDNTHISVQAWRANAVSLFFLNGFLDPKMVEEMKIGWENCLTCRTPEFPTILPAIRGTFQLLDQYQSPVALHALKPGRLGVWLYGPPVTANTSDAIEWPLKSHTLSVAASNAGDAWGPPVMVLTGADATRVYDAFHQSFDACGEEVRERNKLYIVFARPLLPNEFNTYPLPTISLSCSPADGWIQMP